MRLAGSVRSNVIELGTLIRLPFTPREAVFVTEESDGPGLLAILTFRPKEVRALFVPAKRHPPPSCALTVPRVLLAHFHESLRRTWADPAAPVAPDGLSVPGPIVDARELVKPPFTRGAMARLGDAGHLYIHLTR